MEGPVMQATLERIMILDHDSRVLTVLAHDNWLLEVVDLLPVRANDWYAEGGSESRWDFLQDSKLLPKIRMCVQIRHYEFV